MAFRSRELLNKIIRKMGPDSMAPGVKESLKKDLPNSKIVMGRAKRGIYAGKHIQFGNKVSEDGGNKHSEVVFLQLQMRNLDPQIILRTRRTWKPNVQEKRLFSYILDRHIRVKVTTYALRCIDKAGGIDEYLLKTPYHKMDTEMGLFWKAKIEKMYEELGMMEVGFFPPEEEAKLEEGFKQLKIAKREFRREARRKASEASGNQKQINEGNADDEPADDEKPAELELAAA